MIITQTVPPDKEPLTLEQVKGFLRIDHDEEDSFLERLIASARQQAEMITRNQFITATFRYDFDAFPCGSIELPRPPLQSISLIQYVDSEGQLQTVSASDYQVITQGKEPGVPGSVLPAYGKSWPTPRYQPDAVRITFLAGWGLESDEIPQPIIDWMLIRIATLYENRQLYEPGQIATVEFVDMLLRPYVVQKV